MNEHGPRQRNIRGRKSRLRRRPSFVELVGFEAAAKYREEKQSAHDQELAYVRRVRKLGGAGLGDII